MKGRGVVILLVLVVVLVGGVLYFIFRGGEPEPKPEIAGITDTEAGWRVITHPGFNITFRIPDAWQITVFEEGKGPVEASYETEEITASFSIYERPNLFGVTAPQIVQSEPDKFSEIRRDSRTGVSYLTKEGREDPDPTDKEIVTSIEDSYVLVNEFFVDDKIIKITCKTLGEAYETLIPTCERIVGEVHFSQ